MKKIVYSIIIIVIVTISIISANYVHYIQNKLKIEKTNNEFTQYEGKRLQINIVVTLMNKAIQKNIENEIQQGENKIFLENDTNSIKVFLEIKSRNSIIPMEELILNEKAGVEKVEYAFSDLLFNITKIEYHEKTKQIKKVIITAQEEQDNK